MSHTDAERVLQVLIHDVRTPIGVAQGYIRMIQDGRLASADEQARALVKTLDALGRIAKLCEDASVFADGASHKKTTLVTAGELTARVSASASQSGFDVDSSSPIDRKVASTGSLERLAEAIGAVLATVVRPAGSARPRLSITARANELWFVARVGNQTSEDNAPATEFDPWQSRGLAIPLACRTIALAHGRVRRAGQTLIVELPFDPPPVVG